MSKARILIVDDEEAARVGLTRALSAYELLTASDAAEAAAIVAESRPDLILLDHDLPGKTGLDYIRELSGQPAPPQVIMITAHGSERIAAEVIKAGAYDYIVKPFEIEELRLIVRNAIEATGLRRENARLREELAAYRPGGLLGSSPSMRRVYDLIDRVAPTDITVLIRGESGTGKELVARAIHDASATRRAGQFIAMNCAAMPGELIESELFGHEKGAFTGAIVQRRGKFEQANRGTIFLDEIGDMSPNTQAKLLRVLEERSVERLGGAVQIPVDVRVISATNADLETAVEAGRFRSDLYFRLRVVQIDLPPLRERLSDLPLLAAHFLNAIDVKYGLACKAISRAALAALSSYGWPGNVRELRNVIERSAVLAGGTALEPGDLPSEIFMKSNTTVPLKSPDRELAIPFLDDFREARKAFERAYIERCLIETGGNVTKAAERVGMHRQSLQQKLKDLGLSRRYVSSIPDGDES